MAKKPVEISWDFLDWLIEDRPESLAKMMKYDPDKLLKIRSKYRGKKSKKWINNEPELLAALEKGLSEDFHYDF